VAQTQWYHTLELAPGVLTPGWFDLRETAAAVLPERLDGLRCLDVATFDGFWAFEMERRGAAEVLAIDVLDPAQWDWPAGSPPQAREALASRKRGGTGFEVAAAALGSSVRRLERSVYDLEPAEVGSFDLVYVGSLLLHLRDPAGALARVHDVCSGRLVLVESVDALLSAVFRTRPVAAFDGRERPWWWTPNVAALRALVSSAGFTVDAPVQRVRLRAGRGQPGARDPRRVVGALRHRQTRRAAVAAVLGDPHAVVRARPRG
jgi:tRNA (mo5U34)-methyltransferase